MGAAPCNPQDALQSRPDGSQRHEGGLDRIRQVASMRWLIGEANQGRNRASAPQALQSLNKIKKLFHDKEDNNDKRDIKTVESEFRAIIFKL